MYWEVNEQDYNSSLAELEETLDKIKSEDPDWLIKVNDEFNKAKSHFDLIHNGKGFGSVDKNDLTFFLRDINKLSHKRMRIEDVTSDMNRTNRALDLLLDDNKPIDHRINQVVHYDSSINIKGMHKTGPTLLLHLKDPEEFSIWNSTRQPILERMKIFPDVKNNIPIDRYGPLNDIQKRIAKDLGINLWTLDQLWSLLRK